jgi:hypothetical protein
MKGTFEVLDVKALRLDPGIQSRVAMSDDVVIDYVEAIRSEASFPPIGVIFDGETYWVWDGFHRARAHIKARRKTILAEVRQGMRRDAVLLSARANAENGMRRNNDDKRKAVERLLLDEEWSQWSDNEIARRCAVSQPFVSSVRRSLTCNGFKSTERKGADGRTINTANIGRSPRPPEAPMPVNETVDVEGGAIKAVEVPPETFKANGTSENHNSSHPCPPGFLPERLPMDPDVALRLIVKHFSRDAVEALLRGLANWCEKDLVDKPGA